MSRRVLALLFLMTAASFAGPLKVASYPVRHPVKTVKSTVKGTYEVLKAVLW
jgi:hypothetical protein